jgi:hypothetical protein
VNEYEVYILSPQALPWRVAGLLYLLIKKIKISRPVQITNSMRIVFAKLIVVKLVN